MNRLVCLLALAVVVCLCVSGCSLTYYHNKTDGGYERTEFGLLGAGGPGGIPGLIPLYRSNVELKAAEGR